VSRKFWREETNVRIATVFKVCALVVLSRSAGAQRLSQVAPGTVVQLTTQDGATVTGVFGAVSRDSVFLSTTLAHPGATFPLASVRRASYAAGDRASYAGRGALLGAGIGVGLAKLAGRGEEPGSEYRFFSVSSGRTTMLVLGSLLGLVVGSHYGPPRWVALQELSLQNGEGRPVGRVRATMQF
jgi:hypothetical protein